MTNDWLATTAPVSDFTARSRNVVEVSVSTDRTASAWVLANVVTAAVTSATDGVNPAPCVTVTYPLASVLAVVYCCQYDRFPALAAPNRAVNGRRSSIFAAGTVVAEAACRSRARGTAVAGTVGSVGTAFGVPVMARTPPEPDDRVAASNTIKSLRGRPPTGFATSTSNVRSVSSTRGATPFSTESCATPKPADTTTLAEAVVV